jgi:hypothetical protein
MFVRHLVLLISHVLCYFSVLVYCRSLVQIVVQRGEIEQRWNLGPASALKRMPHQPHIPRLPSRHC